MCASKPLRLRADPRAPLTPQHHPASPAGEGVTRGLFLLPSLPAGFEHWQDRGQDLAGRRTSEKAELHRFAALQGQLKCAASFLLFSSFHWEGGRMEIFSAVFPPGSSEPSSIPPLSPSGLLCLQALGEWCQENIFNPGCRGWRESPVPPPAQGDCMGAASPKMRQLCGQLMAGKGDKTERDGSMGGSKPWHSHADRFITFGRSCFVLLSERRARHTKQKSWGMQQGGQLISAGGGISSASTEVSESLF